MGWQRFGPWRRELRSFLELFALTGVAVVQPALDLLTHNATLFITLRSTKTETLALTALLLLAPPIALWIIEVAVGLVFPKARPWAHALLAAGTVAVIAVEALKKQTDFAPRILIGAALVLAVIAGVLIARFEIVRLWLRYLAIAPIIFAVMFLFFSPVTTAVFDGGPSAAHVEIRKPNRVVMIVLDELPTESLLDGTGHIDATLFPHFAALAGDSTWYRNETTVAPYTEQAVPAIITGDYPTDPDKLPVAQAYPHNLFTLLGGTYKLNVHEGLTQLCPKSMCGSNTVGTTRHGLAPLMHDTLELWRDFASPNDEPVPVTFDAASVAGASTPVARSFVRSIEPGNEPRLDYLHVLLPHQPWHLRAGFRDDDFRGITRGAFVTTWGTPWTAQLARQRHRLQLQTTDDLIGEVTARLKRIGAYDRSMIVVTADHGIAFTALNPERGVSEANHTQIMWTPLIVKQPHQPEGRVDDRPVRSIDVLPTMADLLDVKLPWKVDGHSILGAPSPDGPRRIFEWTGNRVQPPAGSKFLTFDGPAGFDTMLGSGTPSSGGDPALSLYRLGPYGGLVGRPVAPLVDTTTVGPAAFVAHRNHFQHVDRDATHIPWTYVQGSLASQGDSQPLAISVNGVVAGMSATVTRGRFTARTSFWASLAPQLFRDGRNELGVYLITGDPSAPRLIPTRLRA